MLKGLLATVLFAMAFMAQSATAFAAEPVSEGKIVAKLERGSNVYRLTRKLTHKASNYKLMVFVAMEGRYKGTRYCEQNRNFNKMLPVRYEITFLDPVAAARFASASKHQTQRAGSVKMPVSNVVAKTLTLVPTSNKLGATPIAKITAIPRPKTTPRTEKRTDPKIRANTRPSLIQVIRGLPDKIPQRTALLLATPLCFVSCFLAIILVSFLIFPKSRGNSKLEIFKKRLNTAIKSLRAGGAPRGKILAKERGSRPTLCYDNVTSLGVSDVMEKLAGQMGLVVSYEPLLTGYGGIRVEITENVKAETFKDTQQPEEVCVA